MHIQKANLSFRDLLQPLQAVTHIIIHHTAEDGWDVYKTHEFHQNNRGWSGIGYNYFIEENGAVYEMTSLQWLCKQFMYKFSLDSKRVLGHRELEGVTKTCPGTRFSMEKLRHVLSNNEKGVQ